MSTIPISPTIVNVTPGVLAAAGAGLSLVGLVLTNNTRVPIGSVDAFTSAAGVSAFFGAGSHQAAFAQVYFNGFNGAVETPGNILFAQYNPTNVSAYLQGGNGNFTLAGVQNLTGTLSVVIDGYTWTSGTINLSAATSLSNAASIITTSLTSSPPSEASGSASVIATESASITASIEGNVMYVTNISSGNVIIGSTVTGTGVTASTVIDTQLTSTALGGALGSTGTYAVNKTQNIASESMTLAYGQLTVGGTVTGAFAVGQTLSGSAVPANDIITALGTGTGGAGTYFVSSSTAVSSTAITGSGTPPVVTYDSVSGAFIVTSGIRGAASTMAFATGTIAAGLFLTQATGALLSQGSNVLTPGAFMTNLVNTTQNWATFTTDFDPDGAPGQIAQKLLFAQWVSQQNNRYCYVEWDFDPAAIASTPATGTFGYQVTQTLQYSGVCPNWEPSDQFLAAFVMGMTAAIDFYTPNGRITTAFKSQSGLQAGVTTQNAASNLAGNPQVAGSFGNGYNFYGAFATANQNFTFYQRGTISGPFTWYDTYVNQIWLNQSFVSDMITLLTNVNSIPYNAAGYAQVEQAIQDTVNNGLLSGVIRAGVTLSSTEITTVNQAAAAAGKGPIASIIQQQGWYFLAAPTAPAVRQSRTSPPFTFYYCDGESIQAIAMGSVVLQ